MHPILDETLCAEALFASHLQASDMISPADVDDVVAQVLRRDGPCACAARMAYEFGEHPDTAVRRMRWARRMVRRLPAPDTPPRGRKSPAKRGGPLPDHAAS
jgi:hypothetical protein